MDHRRSYRSQDQPVDHGMYDDRDYEQRPSPPPPRGYYQPRNGGAQDPYSAPPPAHRQQGHHHHSRDTADDYPHRQCQDRGGWDRDGRDRDGRHRSRSPSRWDSAPRHRERYVDRDHEEYRERRHERSRTPEPYYGAPPNRSVILEGLPVEMKQEDVLYELQKHLKAEGVESVRLIKDKKTGFSRQFAFAQFAGVHEAKQFLDEYHPTFTLRGDYDQPKNTAFRIRVAFSRDKDDKDRMGRSDDDWKCDVCQMVNYATRPACLRCNGPRPRAYLHSGLRVGLTCPGIGAQMAPYDQDTAAGGFAANGDSDASLDNMASQFVLLRGLEPGVSEELLAKGVAKLYKPKPSSPTSGGAKKQKIASTTNEAALGARVNSLRRVLLVRDRRSNESWRYGFAEFNTVEDAQAAMGKFQSLDRFTISSKPVLVSYIHAGVFVPVLQALDDEVMSFSFSPLANPSARLRYWDENAYVSELVVSVPEEQVDTTSNEMELAKQAAAAAGEGLVGDAKESDNRVKKRKADKDAATSNKKVVAPHLQFWTNRHAELHSLPSKNGGKLSEEKDSPGNAEDAPQQSFADINRICCLLCSRQFKAEAEVHKHERVSQLHRDNMKNPDLVKKALAKLNRASTNPDEAAYRDRAKERRQAYNQPKQPVAQHKSAKDAVAGEDKPETSDTAAAAPSKGAALLEKMGWSAGEGLGAQGEGRKEAISTNVYVQGVGLGAEGGKLGDAVEEASRQTKSTTYKDFVNMAKDKAKARFESMS